MFPNPSFGFGRHAWFGQSLLGTARTKASAACPGTLNSMEPWRREEGREGSGGGCDLSGAKQSCADVERRVLSCVSKDALWRRSERPSKAEKSNVQVPMYFLLTPLSTGGIGPMRFSFQQGALSRVVPGELWRYSFSLFFFLRNPRMLTCSAPLV